MLLLLGWLSVVGLLVSIICMAVFAIQKKRTWRKWFLATLGCFVLIIVLATTDNSAHKESDTKKDTSKNNDGLNNNTNKDKINIEKDKFLKNVLTKINAKDSKLETLEIYTFEDKTYSFRIYYKRTPSIVEVQNDTYIVAKSALLVLMEQGRSPSKEWISVNVRGYKKEIGETGQIVYRYFGVSRYNFNTDQIEFEIAEN